MNLDWTPVNFIRRQWEINFRFWLSLLIIFGALGLSALAGLASSKYLSAGLIGLVIGAVGVLALYRYPLLGMIMLIGSIAVPIDGPSHLNLSMMLVAGLTGLWVVEMLITQMKITIIPTRVMRPLAFLICVACLAFAFGQLPWYTFTQPAPLGAQAGGLSMYILSAMAFLLAAHQIKTIRQLEWLVWSFILLGSIFIAGKFLRLDPIILRFFTEEATGSMFWVWLAILSMGQALFNNNLPKILRLALIGMVLGLVYISVLQLQDWKSGWVPAVVGVGTLVVLLSPRLLFLGLIPVAALLPKLINKLISSDAYSYATRVEAWVIVGKIAQVNPILGLGPANYSWYAPLFPIRGYAVRINSHNQYVDLIGQTGLLGLISFFWFFGEAGWLGWQLRNKAPEGFARAYVYSALAGTVATLVSAFLGDWVIPFFYNITMGGFRASMLPWLFLGGLVAIEHLIATSDNQKTHTVETTVSL